MKIQNITKITVVGKAEPTLSNDGKNTYYRVAVMQNGQATNLMVTEDVYNAIPDGLVDVELLTAYDDRYNSFKVDKLLNILTVNGRPFDKTPATPEKTAGSK